MRQHQVEKLIYKLHQSVSPIKLYIEINMNAVETTLLAHTEFVFGIPGFRKPISHETFHHSKTHFKLFGSFI